MAVVHHYTASWEEQFDFKPNLNRARCDWKQGNPTHFPQPNSKSPLRRSVDSGDPRALPDDRSASASGKRSSSAHRSRTQRVSVPVDFVDPTKITPLGYSGASGDGHSSVGILDDGRQKIRRSTSREGRDEARTVTVKRSKLDADANVHWQGDDYVGRPFYSGRERDRQHAVRDVVGKAAQEAIIDEGFDTRYRKPGQLLGRQGRIAAFGADVVEPPPGSTRSRSRERTRGGVSDSTRRHERQREEWTGDDDRVQSKYPADMRREYDDTLRRSGSESKKRKQGLKSSSVTFQQDYDDGLLRPQQQNIGMRYWPDNMQDDRKAYEGRQPGSGQHPALRDVAEVLYRSVVADGNDDRARMNASRGFAGAGGAVAAAVAAFKAPLARDDAQFEALEVAEYSRREAVPLGFQQPTATNRSTRDAVNRSGQERLGDERYYDDGAAEAQRQSQLLPPPSHLHTNNQPQAAWTSGYQYQQQQQQPYLPPHPTVDSHPSDYYQQQQFQQSGGPPGGAAAGLPPPLAPPQSGTVTNQPPALPGTGVRKAAGVAAPLSAQIKSNTSASRADANHPPPSASTPTMPYPSNAAPPPGAPPPPPAPPQSGATSAGPPQGINSPRPQTQQLQMSDPYGNANIGYPHHPHGLPPRDDAVPPGPYQEAVRTDSRRGLGTQLVQQEDPYCSRCGAFSGQHGRVECCRRCGSPKRTRTVAVPLRRQEPEDESGPIFNDRTVSSAQQLYLDKQWYAGAAGPVVVTRPASGGSPHIPAMPVAAGPTIVEHHHHYGPTVSAAPYVRQQQELRQNHDNSVLAGIDASVMNASVYVAPPLHHHYSQQQQQQSLSNAYLGSRYGGNVSTSSVATPSMLPSSNVMQPYSDARFLSPPRNVPSSFPVAGGTFSAAGEREVFLSMTRGPLAGDVARANASVAGTAVPPPDMMQVRYLQTPDGKH